MEIFRRNNVRFIAVNNGIDSDKPDTLEFAPFINIMSEEVKETEKIRKSVYSILRRKQWEQQPRRMHDMKR